MVNYCSRVGARKNYNRILGDLVWPHLKRDVVLLSSCPAASEYLRFEKWFSLIGDQVSDFTQVVKYEDGELAKRRLPGAK